MLRTWEVERNAGVYKNHPKAERDALRLYEGDTRIRDEAGNLLLRQSTDPFYGNKHAYRTLNALLIPGIDNEFSRIEKEGKQLKTIFAEQLEETIRLYCRIFSLMCLCRNDGKEKKEEIVVKRIERNDSLALLKDGHTISFFSASKAGYQKEFAQKDGIILLEVHIIPDVPYLDLEKVLGKEYLAIDEREILLPPFVSITVQEGKLQQADRKIRDLNKKPPLGKYWILADKFPAFVPEPEGYTLAGQMEKEILEERETAVNAIHAMNQKNWTQDFSAYCTWKRKFQTYLRYRFLDMWKLI